MTGRASASRARRSSPPAADAAPGQSRVRRPGLRRAILLARCSRSRLQAGGGRAAAGAAGAVGQGGGPHHRDARALRRHHPAALQRRSRLPPVRPHGVARRRCRRHRHQGRELAALDPAVQELAVRNAEAAVANAEAQLANAAAEEARQRRSPSATSRRRRSSTRSAEPRDGGRQSDARQGRAAQGAGPARLYPAVRRLRRRRDRGRCRCRPGGEGRPEDRDRRAARDARGGGRRARRSWPTSSPPATTSTITGRARPVGRRSRRRPCATSIRRPTPPTRTRSVRLTLDRSADGLPARHHHDGHA